MSRAPPSNCLFLPELPSDLTDAVLERHFRGFVGFTSARTRSDRNGKLVGFVEFDAVDDAVRARDSMQGQSPFEGISWHIHFSNNTKSTPKRPREEAAEPVGRSDAQRLAYSGGGGGGGGGMHDQRPGYDRPQHQMMQPPPPMMQQQSPNTYGPPPGPMYGGGGPMMAPPVPNGSPMHPNYQAQLARDASSTLYVEGLPSDATEREVSHVFRRFEGHGYQSIRMLARESSKTPGKNLYLCFVEFDNAHQAASCLNQMQGYKWDDKATDQPGIKISFAKSKAERRSAGPPPPQQRGAPPRSSDYDERPRESEPHDDGDRDYRDYRRDGREHRDSYRDDYEDSERGDDDYINRGAADYPLHSDDGLLG